MNKKVLIISSSPRKGDNSETLAAAFAKGAREAGNQVETVYLLATAAEDDVADAKAKHQNEMVFPIGAPNDTFAKYFIGQSYLAPLSTQQVGIYNVTFEPGCRNNWHIHHAKSGGGQILICVAGRGYYQEWDKPAQELRPGDAVNIPVGVKHWHGAAPDSWFSHLAVEVPGDETSNEWLEAVDNTVYFNATGKEV